MPDHVVSASYQIRAGELLEILKGAEKEKEFFASSFLNAVPLPQFRAGMTQIKAQYGEPVAISRIIPASERDGTIEVMFEKATVAFRMIIDQAEPHPVVGLQVTGAKVRDDALSKIAEEFNTLSGSAGFEIARLNNGRSEPLTALNADRQYAIGSAFKLYVLAELSRSIDAGERQWSDILTINQKSLPSGVIQNWPDGAPLTLQTLATLMISISDNTATDLLINELGRDRIASMVRQTNHRNPAKTLPILTTLELFALKMPVNEDLREKYTRSDDAQQLQLLQDEKQRLGLKTVKIENLANKPQHIEEIEWFASPGDTNNLLADIARTSDPVVKKIMAIGASMSPGDKLRWSYVGSKGGSEPGVVSFVFLVASKSGQDYAVSGSWNDPEEPVDGNKFQTLMNRLLNILAEREN